ncbi:DMT family transporter [Novispirillum itersonii]|uniref:O-acetylserine/cysteine efflux transporter n=1 Tax=Novispirillum itersonii TaxID=189 RepID=A0A7X0DNB6_NOVIT|nr:EamA family transporter [Novispirillum itersonii]MBB6211968.1 O-acetylserine/cysteine efflux transporter [Novispirillum itersonii]
MSIRDTLLALFVMVLWGANYVAVKLGVSEFPPLLLITLRFAVVAVLLVPFYRITRKQVPGVLLLSFTFGSAHFALLFVALKMTEAGTSALLLQLGVPFSTLLGVVFLGDRLGVWRVSGLLVAFAGAAVLAWGPNVPAIGPAVLLVVSAFFWAVSNLLVKKVTDVSPIALTGWMSLFAVPQCLLWTLIFETGHIAAIEQAHLIGWGAMLYTAIGSSIVAYGLWYWLLGRYTVSQVVPISLLNPVFGVLVGAWVLGESIGPEKIAGGLLTLGGVGIILWRQAKKGAA